jgi:WD40 repeat protein
MLVSKVSVQEAKLVFAWLYAATIAGVVGMVFGVSSHVAYAEDAIDYDSQIQPIFTRYCVGCHGENGGESDVSLASLKSINSGYPKGSLIVPGDPGNSKILQLMLGQEPKMPPEDELEPTADEIEMVRKWIAAGARGDSKKKSLMDRSVAPKLLRADNNLSPVFAIAPIDKHMQIVGLQGGVAIQEDRKAWDENTVVPAAGKVTQIRPNRDRTIFAVSAGIPGVGGQVLLLSRDKGVLKVEREMEAHTDVVNAAVLSPDSKILATAGHDRSIHLWNVATGGLIRSLTGHNGAVYDVAFDLSGSILASASADETIKIWNAVSGERLDTLGQCEGEQYAVRFSHDGKRVIAAGADKRIRSWSIASQVSPAVSTMTHSVFAHEGAVLAMEISEDGELVATVGEDRLVKVWKSNDIQAIGIIGKLEDMPTGVMWRDPRTVAVTSMDGKVNVFTVNSVSDSVESADRVRGADRMIPKPDSGQGVASQTDVSQSQQPAEVVEEAGVKSSKSPQRIPTNASVSGVLLGDDVAGDEPGDWYSFEARQGDHWIVTIAAAAKGSKLDSLIDVLDPSGQPILRTRLQAVRESYFTFRGKDSTIADDFRMHRWEDMELNEYLYASGEVVKLWMYPRGPDSGFRVYPGRGNRVTYFDTTATTHALNEPAWIVTELQSDSEPIPNGQPVFPIYYSNDDASHRRSGTDSQIHFVAPHDGVFLIRLRDARGQSGADYHYQLTAMPPRPRFTVRAEQKEVSVRPGVGTEFSMVADRWDGLDQEIRFEISGIPEGLQITQDLSVQPEQISARGTLYMSEGDSDRIPEEFTLQFTPSATIASGQVIRSDSFELKVKKAASTKLKMKVVEIGQGFQADSIPEVVIKAGTTARVQLAIDRGGVAGDLAFGNEESGRNLPHGVFVDNIGLNGLLIPASENAREVFITAAPWVPEQVRYFHLRAEGHDNPTTAPVRIRVIR